MNEKISNSGNGKRASLTLVLSLFAIFCMILFFLLNTPIEKFNSNDPYPEISTLVPSKIIEFGGSPTTVNVGLYIRDIPTFDILNSRFIVDAILIFKFDHREISLDRIGKFKFDRARVIEQSPPQTKIDGHNLISRYDVKMELNTTLNFRDFPLDDHRVNISLTNYNLTPSEVLFSSSIGNLTINPDLKIAGWEIVDKMVKTGFLTDKTSTGAKIGEINNPRIVFSLDFENVGIRSLLTLLIPLMIIFLISTITLTFEHNITTTSIAMVSALIAYKFVIENMSPKTGYLMISDNFFLYIFFGCIAIFVFNLFAGETSSRYKNGFTIILYIIYAILFTYNLYPLLG